MLFSFFSLSLGLFYVFFLWILLLLVQVKHKEEFSQAFITKIEFLRRDNEDKRFKTQQTRQICKNTTK